MTTNKTEPKPKNDATPRKERVSSLEKAQSDLAKLKEKRNEIDKKIAAMEEKCMQLLFKTDSDVKAKAFGISAKSEAPAVSSETPASK